MREIKLEIKPADGTTTTLIPGYIRKSWAGAYENALAQNENMMRAGNANYALPFLVRGEKGAEFRAATDPRGLHFTHPDNSDSSVSLPFHVEDMVNLPHGSGSSPSAGGKYNWVFSAEMIDAVVEEFSWIRSLSFTPLWRTVASLGLEYKWLYNNIDAVADMVSTPDRVLAGGTFRILVDDDTEVEEVHAPSEVGAGETQLIKANYSGWYSPMGLNVTSHSDVHTTRVKDILDGDYALASEYRVAIPEDASVGRAFVQNGFFGNVGYANDASWPRVLTTSSSEVDNAGTSYYPVRELETVYENPGPDGGEKVTYQGAAPTDATSEYWLDQLLPQRFATRLSVRESVSGEVPYDTDAFTAGVTFALGSIGG